MKETALLLIPTTNNQAPVRAQGHRLDLHRLLLLNLVLQAFDGIATYQGLRVGFREANPLLVAAFDVVGVGPALLLFKLKACGLLVLLHRYTPTDVGISVLRMLATVYCVLSLIPWMGKFLSLVTLA